MQPLYIQTCAFPLLSLEPWEEFCWPATFLDLSLSLLTAAAAPSYSFPFSLPHPPSYSPALLFNPSMRIKVSFSCVRLPVSVTAPCLPISLPNSEPALVSSWRDQVHASQAKDPWQSIYSIIKNNIYSGHTFRIISQGEMYQWETKVFTFQSCMLICLEGYF